MKKYLLSLVLIALISFSSLQIFAQSLSLVSVNSAGQAGNGASFGFSISADGRYIAFSSDATNLSPNVSGEFSQNYVRDMQTGEITLVSANLNGVSSNGYADYTPEISGNGRFVAFWSDATDLVEQTPLVKPNLYIRDLATGTPRLVTTHHLGKKQYRIFPTVSFLVPGRKKISPDGSFVLFEDYYSLGANLNQIHVLQWDSATGAIRLVSNAKSNAQVSHGGIMALLGSQSQDGRFVSYFTYVNGIVPFEEGRRHAKVFLKNMLTGATELISVSRDGEDADGFHQDGRASADGRYVVFQSDADNLTGVSDTNQSSDIFIRDQAAQTTELISKSSSQAASGNGSSILHAVTPDGRFVVFQSDANNLAPNDTNNNPDIFIWDRITGNVIMASRGISTHLESQNIYSYSSVSDDGRFIGMHVIRGNRGSDEDVFVFDRQAGSIINLTSRPPEIALGEFSEALVSSNGSRVVFNSPIQLIPSDTNQFKDVYTKNLLPADQDKAKKRQK